MLTLSSKNILSILAQNKRSEYKNSVTGHHSSSHRPAKRCLVAARYRGRNQKRKCYSKVFSHPSRGLSHGPWAGRDRALLGLSTDLWLFFYLWGTKSFLMDSLKQHETYGKTHILPTHVLPMTTTPSPLFLVAKLIKLAHIKRERIHRGSDTPRIQLTVNICHHLPSTSLPGQNHPQLSPGLFQTLLAALSLSPCIGLPDKIEDTQLNLHFE